MLRTLPLLVLAACSFNHRAVGTIAATIPATPTIESLEIVNTTGSVEVRATNGANEPSVEVTVLLNESRPETDFDPDFATHVEMERSGGAWRLVNRHANQADSKDWQLRFVVRVPAGGSVKVEQAVGIVDVQLPRTRDITVDNVTGSTTIAVPTIEGRVSALTATGRVRVTVTDNGPTAGCDIQCTTGKVVMELPETVHGDFSLDVATGAIDVNADYGLSTEREVTSASAKGRVGKGGTDYRLHVVTGQITLR